MSKQRPKSIKYYGTVAISFTMPKTARAAIPLKSENRRQLVCIIMMKIIESSKLNDEKLQQIISAAMKKDTMSSCEFGSMINQYVKYSGESNQLYK